MRQGFVDCIDWFTFHVVGLRVALVGFCNMRFGFSADSVYDTQHCFSDSLSCTVVMDAKTHEVPLFNATNGFQDQNLTEAV